MGMPVQEFSDELSELTGKKKGKRTDVVKWVWVYIKANDLQNPDNGREIFMDDTMKAVYGNKKKLTMFEVAGKQLSKHLFDI